MFGLIFIGVILFLLILLSMIWPPDSPWAPWWRTNKNTAKAICEIAKIDKHDVIYDLGCGDGEVLIACGKLGAAGVGVEIEPSRAIIAKIRVFINKLQQKIVIKRKSFYDEDISKATVVIVYLVPKTLEKLIPKFKQELKKGTKIVSYRYKMNLSLKEEDKKNKLYLYII